MRPRTSTSDTGSVPQSAVVPREGGATPRPQDRVPVGENLEVPLTVNGTPVVLSVPGRLTLADALRDHLGLTGTHLGCEHGVCGMCTVLVDGYAARACLLFACQLPGAEILTVEGMGRPDDLHPLQAAFTRHHALQCGFCTPGFLLSAYDLLDHHPAVTEQELPEQLSGVLCRCTGYRGIVAAVAEVAHDHPEGVPPPGNCGARTLVGRGHQLSSTNAPATDELPAADTVPVRAMTMPTGDPTVEVDVSSDVAPTPEDVWRVVQDTHLLARCLPGAELTEDLGDDRYRGRARVALGPVRLSFTGTAHIVERDAGAHRLRVLGEAKDPSGGSVRADILLEIEPSGRGSRVHAHARVFLVGRIAQFGRSLAADVSHTLFEQFAEALGEAAAGREPPTEARPPNPLRMLVGALRGRLLRAWRRVSTRTRRTRNR